MVARVGRIDALTLLPVDKAPWPTPDSGAGVVQRQQTFALRVAGTVFGIVAAGHLLRLATRANIVIAGWEVPLGLNALGALIAGGLCIWLWRLSRQ